MPWITSGSPGRRPHPSPGPCSASAGRLVAAGPARSARGPATCGGWAGGGGSPRCRTPWRRGAARSARHGAGTRAWHGRPGASCSVRRCGRWRLPVGSAAQQLEEAQDGIVGREVSGMGWRRMGRSAHARRSVAPSPGSTQRVRGAAVGQAGVRARSPCWGTLSARYAPKASPKKRSVGKSIAARCRARREARPCARYGLAVDQSGGGRQVSVASDRHLDGCGHVGGDRHRLTVDEVGGGCDHQGSATSAATCR